VQRKLEVIGGAQKQVFTEAGNIYLSVDLLKTTGSSSLLSLDVA